MHSVFVILYLPLHIQLTVRLKKSCENKNSDKEIDHGSQVYQYFPNVPVLRQNIKNHFHSTRTKHRYWVYYRNIQIMFVGYLLIKKIMVSRLENFPLPYRLGYLPISQQVFFWKILLINMIYFIKILHNQQNCN